MTAETYVKQILKKVRCSSTKKKEIKKQLLADIKERTAQGETLEEVLSHMGTVQEVADSFHENISEAEQKKYKRNKRIKWAAVIIVFLAALVYLMYWSLPKAKPVGSSKIFSRTTVEEKLMETIRLLDSGDYDMLQKKSSVQMADILTEEKMEPIKQKFSDDWGTQKNTGAVEIMEVLQRGKYFAVCQVTVSYENTSVTYTVSFDESMKIAGLYMK